MSEPDNFLSRWSRRKLEQESGDPAVPETEQSADAQSRKAEPEISVAAVAPQDATARDLPQDPQQEPPFDPASLPPVESISAGTDIRDFLKPGVPLSLSRAALRRAWTSDPAIRDFIGIAENQWDFTNNSIPGFGPIDPAEIPGLLAKVISSSKEGAEALANLTEEQSEIPQSVAPKTSIAKDETGSTDETRQPAPAPESEPIASADNAARDTSPRDKENGTAQNDETDRELNYAQVRHGHGSALPN
jgi:hypothetical protein